MASDTSYTWNRPYYSPAYGEMWNKTYGGFQTIDLVTSEVYAFITSVECGVIKDFSCVSSTGNLTVNNAGKYLITLSLSAEAVVTAGEYGTKLFVNGVGQDNCYAFNDFENGVSSSSTFTCLKRLYVGDVLRVGVDDHANPVRDLTINSYNLNVVKINS